MILDRLVELRDRIPDDDVVPRHHKRQKVSWTLAISPDGRVTGVVPAGEGKKGWQSAAPYLRRTSATRAFLLVDKPDYVLGLDADENNTDRAADRHAAYLELLADAVEQTDDPDARTVHDTLSDPEQVQVARYALAEQKWGSGDLVAPRVGETYPHQKPVLRRVWQRMQDAGAAEKSGLEAACLVCGTVGPIARTHPVEVRIGPNPAPLVTGNANAFLSYGLQQSEIAPLCFECAEAYGQALRYLTTSDEHNLYLRSATWLFWTREPADTDWASLFSDPQPKQVEALLLSAQKGTPPSGETDLNRFYALVVSGERKRMAVRSWLEQPLPEARRHLATYFKRQRVTDRNGEVLPLKLFALAGATVRDLKDLPPQTPDLLLRHALTGTPLPLTLLHQALRRAHAERNHPVTRPRAALIRLTLESNGTMTSEALVRDHREPAYHCGRLLALLDDVQRVALNTTNATLVDRFFGSASTTPAAVFGTLMRKAQPHLSKLRKNKPGLERFFQNEIADVAARIDRFPTTLTPQQQGLFALGFYHQQHRPKNADAPTDEDTPEVDAPAA